MEEMENTGVNESVAAEQTDTTQAVDNIQQTQENTGVESKPDAGANEKVERAFAARLKEATEKAKQEARDEYIASQGYEWNGKPITTEAEYTQALKEKEIYDKYQAQGLPDEVVNELVESKKFREQFEADKQTKAEQERKTAEYNEFFEYFRNEHGRDFNSVTDIIPPEVWEMTQKGKTLTDAYTYHHAAQLKAKIAEYEAKLQAQQTNQNNAASSPGSVTGNGNAKDTILTPEMIENMSTSELSQRWGEVKKVMGMK